MIQARLLSSVVPAEAVITFPSLSIEVGALWPVFC